MSVGAREPARQDPARQGTASSKGLLEATAVMASGTMISRVLGVVRTMLVAFALGNTTAQGDTFTLATLVPNTLYLIFAGGALNTMLVPQIVRHLKQDADDGEAFLNRLLTAFTLALAVVTVLAFAFTPQVMSLWLGDAWQTARLAPQRDALFLMAYLTMPQLFFYGAFFLVGQVLNAKGKFGPMMWAPIANNVVQIGILGAYAVTWGSQRDHSVPFTTEQALLLGIGSSVGIVVQTAVLIPALRSIGFRYRPRFDLVRQGLGASFHLAKWVLGYVFLTTLTSIVVARLASTATVSDPAKPGPGLLAYNEAYLTWILPHSLLTVALATVMLPRASRLAADHDLHGVGEVTARTLRLANTFLLPSSIALLVLADPFCRLVFGNGAGAGDWRAVASTLMCFAVGLVPFTIQYVYLRGFYALDDSRSPFLLQIGISGMNAVLALAWIALDPDPQTVAPRLALAFSLSYVFGAAVTFVALRRRLQDLDAPATAKHLVQVLIAMVPGTALAALVTWLASGTDSQPLVLAGFLAALLVMVGPYLLIAKRMRIVEVSEALHVVLRRRAGRTDADAIGAAEPEDSSLLSEPERDALHLGAWDAPGEALLTYPDPADADHSAADGVRSDDASQVQAGDVLDGRYRLDRILMHRGRALSWLGLDQTLARAVLIHVLPSSEPHTLEILDEARRAAPTTDSRFLRVLDVVLAEDRPYGSYIVCEYAQGESLEIALHRGALSEHEACWIVREVADGLVAMHAQGLYHRHLNPDTIIITASGNVKIVGFLLEEALHPGTHDETTPGEPQDVAALGHVLYAALLGRWPGGRAYGLPAAQTDGHGRVLLPRQGRSGLSAAVSETVSRIISPASGPRTKRLTTAAQVAEALNAILAGADASHELERRLSFPVQQIRLSLPRDEAADAAAKSAAACTSPVGAAANAVATPDPNRAGHTDPRVDGDQDTAFHQGVEDTAAHQGVEDTASHQGVEDTAPIAFDPFEDDPASPSTPSPYEPDSPVLFTPVPPPPAHAASPDAGSGTALQREVARRQGAGLGLKLLIGLFGLALFAGLTGVFVNQYNRSHPTATPAVSYAISGVRDFDPSADGGDGRENATLARLAMDGQTTTFWTTERYAKSADLNGRKPGVGLVVDLGAIRSVGHIQLTLGAGATAAEIRVPKDAGAADPPMKSRNDWDVAATVPASTGSFTVTIPTPVETRYVLVYLTRLPAAASGSGFQGSVGEIGVGS